MDSMSTLLHEAEKAISESKDLNSLQQVKAQYLGKKGQLTAQLKQLGALAPDDRKTQGAAINQAKNTVLEWVSAKQQALEKAAVAAKLAHETVDVTLPGRQERAVGGWHPVTATQQRLTDLFQRMGFSVEEGPEIESEYFNFEALNIPKHHPARAMQDTFYVEGGDVLRTHTSPVQIHTMQSQQPPLRIIAPGRVYRCDSDVTHTPMFHQIEGLVVDKNINFAHLKGFLNDFLKAFFEDDALNIRLRSSYFPFTEPSAEVDIAFGDPKGPLKWMEVLGCGMVHPNVLRAGNIDPDVYSGFAFGLGVDRMAMLHYGVNDLRQFFDNDLRFLEAF